MGSLPTIVLLPGSFAPASSLDKLAAALQAAGFPANIAALSSATPKDPRTATCIADVEHVREAHVKPLIESGHDVVLFGHSYGGIVAGGAAYGCTASPDHKGVVGIILHSGMILSEGASLAQVFGGTLPAFILQDQPSPGLSVNSTNLGYPGTPHATAALTSPAPKPVWAGEELNGQLVYIRTTAEKEGLAIQDAVIAASGASWIVEDVDGPHDAFETRTHEVVDIMSKYVKQWSRA